MICRIKTAMKRTLCTFLIEKIVSRDMFMTAQSFDYKDKFIQKIFDKLQLWLSNYCSLKKSVQIDNFFCFFKDQVRDFASLSNNKYQRGKRCDLRFDLSDLCFVE